MMRSKRSELRVGAAADLSRAFREIAPLFERTENVKVTLVLGSTGHLAKQAENGAPFDVFAAADERYIRDLETSGAVAPGSRALYAIGRVAIWTKRGSPPVRSIHELAESRFRKIAIANPLHAPYGRAAKEALTRAGLWSTVETRLVYGENVMQTLQYAQSGNADAAFVALSIAKGSGGDYILVPESLHTPLRQALGILSQSENPALAAKFAKFINGPNGRSIMRKYGFLLPGERAQ